MKKSLAILTTVILLSLILLAATKEESAIDRQIRIVEQKIALEGYAVDDCGD